MVSELDIDLRLHIPSRSAVYPVGQVYAVCTYGQQHGKSVLGVHCCNEAHPNDRAGVVITEPKHMHAINDFFIFRFPLFFVKQKPPKLRRSGSSKNHKME